MTPRPPKPKSDDAATTPSPLKPKNEKAKVEKTKPEKPKSEKAKAAAVKGEKIEKAVKAKVAKAAAAVADKEEKVTAEPSVKATATVKKEKEKLADKDGGKEKVKPVNGDEAIELIAGYLKSQNRPYSATEVSANLHGKITKTVADKLLKEMDQSGLIMAKATNGTNKGSQWVFWAIQDPADAATPEELSTMEASITTLRESLPSLKSALKALGARLHTLKSAPTTTELVAMVENLRAGIRTKGEKLEGFASASVKMVTKDEVDRVDKEFKYWATKRRARITAFRNLEGHLLDMGMSKDDIEDKVGVEADTCDG